MRHPGRRSLAVAVLATIAATTVALRASEPASSAPSALSASASPSASSPSAPSTRSGLVHARLLAINDFHGHLESKGLRIDGGSGSQPAGGAAYLAAQLRALKRHHPGALVVSAGDMVGASPMISGYFHDEPTVEVMNRMVDVGAVGNHEFDEGSAEFRRLVHGGCTGGTTCRAGHRYTGATFDLLAANVLVRSTGEPLLPPTTIRTVGGARIGFVGVTTIDTRRLVTPSTVADITFTDPAATIARYAPQLRAAGADAVVAIVHEGAAQDRGRSAKLGSVNSCRNITGAVVDIARTVAPQVDAVISGHSHRAYNCRVGGVPLTQAGTYGRLVTTVDLTIDPARNRVTRAITRNVVVDHDRRPDAAVARIVARYRKIVAPVAARVVGTLKRAADRSQSRSGESRLGDLVADAQLAATRGPAGAQLAVVQSGVLRSDLPKGPVRAGDVWTAQPFGVPLVTRTYTGRQLDAALEAQFCNDAAPNTDRRIALNVSSSFSYRYDPRQPCGHRIRMRDTRLHGTAIRPDLQYRVTTNPYLSLSDEAGGGFAAGTQPVVGVTDQAALTRYLAKHRGLTPPHRTRITPR